MAVRTLRNDLRARINPAAGARITAGLQEGGGDY
jgi:hypothetical protein